VGERAAIQSLETREEACAMRVCVCMSSHAGKADWTHTLAFK